MDDKMIWQSSLLLSQLIYVGGLSNGLNYHWWNENWKLTPSSNNSEWPICSCMINISIYKPIVGGDFPNRMNSHWSNENWHVVVVTFVLKAIDSLNVIDTRVFINLCTI